MSQQLINLSSDLKRLRDEGYEVDVRSAFLLVHNIPYVNANKEVRFGILVSTLTLAGDRTATPDTHVVLFIGDCPCNRDGSEMEKIINGRGDSPIADGLVAKFSFSSKPDSPYTDYYEKMSTYATILSTPAEALDPNVTARTRRVIEATEDESVFNYLDTASSRAGIHEATKKLAAGSIAVVGLGGTGSYVLDLVAKTPIQEIHLIDGDYFLSHNAFRAPGAASVEELREAPKKVHYFRDRYAKMRRSIVAHDFFLDASNVDMLKDMSFVFLCLDDGPAKSLIIERLEAFNIPFVDAGIGVELVGDTLVGVVRTTASTERKRDHVRSMKRISFAGGEEDKAYSRNIQIADLNALNASLAVIKWKKIAGFYADYENEHHSTYTIDGNMLLNEDCV